MKSLRLIPIFLCLFISVYGQKKVLKGSVIDTLNTPLVGATVMLLQAKDSVLIKFAITDTKGEFSFEKLAPKDYVLQITYLGYAPLNKTIIWEDEQVLNLGNLQLTPENALLDVVEVKAAHIPIQFKNDTVEYNAAAFQTRPNAAVEDLLKKLPGVEIERDGTIKAHGENVQKVLVDGKEFFGDDPKIATKNLPADAVENVQVFDKKSDIAEFSGIDDGREAKTINLSLKEDKKKGYFGRVTGGYGTEDRYEGKFNINRFSNNIQFSGIGMFNNTNQFGFSINDYINMMGGLNNLLSGGSGRIELNLDSDELGLPLDAGQNNQGFTKTGAGGLNLNWEINKKTKLHTSYFYNNIKREIDRSTFQQNLLEDQSFSSTRESSSISNTEGHRLNANLESKIDPLQTIKWRTSIGINNKSGTDFSNSKTYNVANVLENTGIRNYETKGDGWLLNSNFIYLRKFKKKGRFFTGNLAYERRSNEQTASLASINDFIVLQSDSIQQDQLQESSQNNYGLQLTYTEPLGGRKYLEINYSFQEYNNNLEKDVYDTFDQRAILNEQLSNHFKRDYRYNRAGFNFKWNQKKWNLNLGALAQNSDLKGHLVLDDINIKKSFFNVLPRMRFNYDFQSTKTFTFNYDTRIREPALSQMQAIVDNSDPLNIYIGNPALTPEYYHDFRFSFNSFDRFSSISLFINVNASIIENKIINAKTIGNNFSQTNMPVNYKGEQTMRAYISFGAPLNFIASRININSNLGYQKGNYLVNDIGNTYRSLNSNLDVYINNRNTDIFDIMIGAKMARNRVKYADVSQNQSYDRQIFYTDLAVNIGKNWTISSSMDYTRYSAASFGEATNLPIWQGALSCHILKDQRGTIKLQVHDILNKNLGINRSNSLNYVLEERVASLGRYFLLSFSYALSAFRAQDDGIEMVRRR